MVEYLDLADFLLIVEEGVGHVPVKLDLASSALSAPAAERSELEDEDEVVEMINGAADDSVSPVEFHEWVRSRLLPPSDLEAGGSSS